MMMKLFICNDDNTVDHVVSVLQQYMGLSYLHCVSIATIVHNTGLCLIKESNKSDIINELFEILTKQELTVRIEDKDSEGE